MSAIKDFFSGIQLQYQAILDQIQEIQTSLDSISQGWTRLSRLFETIFSILPLDAILLLAIAIFLLFFINTISPTTPRLNLTVAVLALSGFWYYLASLFSDSPNYGRIFYAIFIILLPLYGFSFLRWAIVFAWKRYQRSKNLHPKTLEEAVFKISEAYHKMMQEASGILAQTHKEQQSADQTRFWEKIKDLKDQVQALETLKPKS